ncbi:GNAT family N-acetyltransferase [Altibacter sp.]|uniref:GNAT family N-acetyltransferase n=1 Tax=Altibacter sp. TaxID=2024823 RepID=UPI0025835853|nr:GNAT family N-acetyltransferase [Altibacter sp.]MCW8981766.1 GNAT family N-acetyltransferase [Altibacter sp.]MCW9037031.1 GNAT family N-acetyltransferase [Altibacter sp.]
MTAIVRTHSENDDFISLVRELDSYLAITDGDEHAFYDQYNKLDSIKHVLVAYEHRKPVGCGAIKHFNHETVEVKRMYTIPAARGKGIAGAVLKELEDWARELGYTRCILETGKRQVEAVLLYRKKGYVPIANYGQYKGQENSLCFEKQLD